MKPNTAARREVEFRPATRFSKDNISPIARVSMACCDLIEAEGASDRSGLFPRRTVANMPQIFTAREWQRITESHFIHETGRACDVCPDFAKVLHEGLGAMRAAAMGKSDEFSRCVAQEIDAVEKLCHALKTDVPMRPADNFKEALIGLRILKLCLSCEGVYGIALGRLDQYLMPYLRADLIHGRETKDHALALLKSFFASLAEDIDLEPGIHPGHAECLTFGGPWNELSTLCMFAIDELDSPNVKYLPDVRRTLNAGALVSQHIAGLIAHGYAPADAQRVVYSARNELIIPHCGADRFRIAAIDNNDPDMDNTLHAIAESLEPSFQLPAPLLSAMMDGCLEQGLDISQGLRYNNDYIHCAGLNRATSINNARGGRLLIEGEGAPYASWFL